MRRCSGHCTEKIGLSDLKKDLSYQGLRTVMVI